MHPSIRKKGGIGIETLAPEWVASLPCPPPREKMGRCEDSRGREQEYRGQTCYI